MTHEELYKKNGVQLESGSFGSNFWTGVPLHYGDFTDNNPHYQQMKANPNMPRQDIDALYSRAVEWQANYYSTLEQRDYADPMNEIQRQRRAGYNPDLAGASGVSSGSSGTSSGASVPASSSDVSFSNRYENASTIFQGVQTACNVVNTIASFGTATIDAVEKVRTMPSRVSLANTQAYVADQAKDEIVQSQSLSNVNDRLGLVNQLSAFFTPDSTAEDYVNILGALGFSGEEIPGYERSIREYHTNPAYKAYYEDNVKRLNDLSAYNAVYTTDVQNELYEGTLFVQRSDNNLARLNSQIQTSLSTYLADNGYGTEVAENMLSSSQLEGKQLEFSRARLDRDIKAFSDTLSMLKQEIKRVRGRINEIRDNAQKEHRAITPSEQLEIDTLANLSSQMLTLGSSHLSEFFTLVDNVNAITYQNEELFGKDGNPKIDVVTPRYVRTLDITFGNYVKGEGFNLSDFLSSIIPNVGVRLNSSTVSRK